MYHVKHNSVTGPRPRDGRTILTSPWAGEVQAVLRAGLDLRDRCNAGALSEHGMATARGRLTARLGRLVDAPPPLDDTERFAGHLATEFPAVFLFLWDPSLDATNWRAEQAIRPAVVMAVNPDGVALGVLRAAFDAPEPPTPEEKGQPKPREERKSFRWVEGLRDCAAAAEQLGETRVVCTMDREADFLDLFIERRTHAPQVELLVRAKVDRVLGQQKTADGQTVSRRLFDEVRNAPARGAAMVEVRRLSARVKASKQPPKDGRAARVAEVTLRYQPVALPCPGTEPVELFVVHAREQQAPPAVEPLEWFVLTTLRVTSADDATRILGWYALRWRIEEYFRVLHPTRCHGLRFRTAGSIRMILQVQPPRSGARAGLACFIEVLRLANVPNRPLSETAIDPTGKSPRELDAGARPRSRQPCAGVNVSRSPGPSTYSAEATFGGQRSPRLKVTASKGRMRTGASSCAVAISTHSPSRSAKASRVRSAGSTSHR